MRYWVVSVRGEGGRLDVKIEEREAPLSKKQMYRRVSRAVKDYQRHGYPVRMPEDLSYDNAIEATPSEVRTVANAIRNYSGGYLNTQVGTSDPDLMAELVGAYMDRL